MKRLFAGTLTAMLALSLTACGQQEQGDAKPVIYLYPEQERRFPYRWIMRHAHRDVSGV